MDILNLSTVKNEKEGKWFRVELYGQEQPFALKLLGSDSDRVIAFQRDQIRKIKSINKEYDELSDEELDEFFELNDDAIIIRINGISSISYERRAFGKAKWELDESEPVTIGDTVLKNDEESYRLLIEKIPAIKDFILEKTKDRANFLD